MSDYTIRGHPFMTSTQKESGGEEGGGGVEAWTFQYLDGCGCLKGVGRWGCRCTLKISLRGCPHIQKIIDL